MRTHFISRLALLLTAGFLVVASQVWTGDTLQWLFVAGGAVMILVAAVDAVREHVGQRALDGLIALLGAWTIVQAFIFDGTDLKWWSFASGRGSRRAQHDRPHRTRVEHRARGPRAQRDRPRPDARRRPVT